MNIINKSFSNIEIKQNIDYHKKYLKYKYKYNNLKNQFGSAALVARGALTIIKKPKKLKKNKKHKKHKKHKNIHHNNSVSSHDKKCNEHHLNKLKHNNNLYCKQIMNCENLGRQYTDYDEKLCIKNKKPSCIIS
jgi:hypothetical protein